MIQAFFHLNPGIDTNTRYCCMLSVHAVPPWATSWTRSRCRCSNLALHSAQTVLSSQISGRLSEAGTDLCVLNQLVVIMHFPVTGIDLIASERRGAFYSGKSTKRNLGFAASKPAPPPACAPRSAGWPSRRAHRAPPERASLCFLCCRRLASLPLEVSDVPLNLIAHPCRRSYPCRKWKSASFG